LESVYPIRRKNFVTGRIEIVDKDELFSGEPEIVERLERTVGTTTFRIGAFTIGYTRDIDLCPYLETGIGANFTTYTLADAIKPYYGDHPVGLNIYLRVRLRPR
jgi:hypothetical protein